MKSEAFVPSTDYRADIDGLRAIAVLLVMLYHGELLGLSGGFIGVDVFFVISGFLITQQLLSRVRGPRDLWDFYERRARRILPALFAMLAVTGVIAVFWLLPDQRSDFGRGLLAATTFVSNLHFWQQTGYFQGPAESEPLIHTWSLAIEEQFYLLFPLLLLALARGTSRHLRLWLGALTLLSLALSVWATNRYPSANFYLAPTRAWELLLGACLAAAPLATVPQRIATASAASGLVLIAVAAAFFTRSTPFPGLAALAPCVGAALLLRHAPLSGWPRKLMAWRPLAALGLISYSLYLWHWPLLVFYTQYRIVETTALERIAILGASSLIAWGSWRYLELPVRSKRWLPGRQQLLIACLTATLIIGGFGLCLWAGYLVGPRATPEVQRILSVVEEKDGHFQRCTGNTDLTRKACQFGAEVPAETLLWGDSHALAAVPGLARAATAAGQSFVYAGSQGCAGLIASNPPETSRACTEINTAVLESLRTSPIRHVILASRWVALAEGRSRALGPAEYDEPPLIARYTDLAVDPRNSVAVLTQLLQATVDRLDGLQLRTSLIYPVPEVGYVVPDILARLAISGRPLDSFTRPASLYRERNHRVIAALDELRSARELIRIRPALGLCDRVACRIEHNGLPLYLDDDHLSRYGAERLAPLMAPIFVVPGGPTAASAPANPAAAGSLAPS